MKLIFLGAPGAGKGTQAKIVADKLSIPHISTGDIYRENMSQETPLGLRAKSFYDKGQLVPDDVTNEMVKERLSRDDCEDGYIMDGYPRTIPQAAYFDTIQQIDRAVFFALSDEEAMKRMLHRAETSNRSDDTKDVITKRIEVYKQQTAPLVEFYKQKGVLLEIDASPSIEVISEDVLKQLQA